MNPNILLFVPDDIGLEYWRIFERLPVDLQIQLPNFTRFAQSGVTFTRAYSQPWCSPTRAALLTGRYGFQTGIGSLAEGQNQTLLDYEVCLPTALKIATDGLYTCGAFGKWHLSDWSTKGGAYEHPYRVGFDHFEGHLRNLEGNETYDAYEGFTCTAGVDAGTVRTRRFPVREWSPRWLARRAGEWIRAQKRPWFCYFAINLPHAPFNRPPVGTYDASKYVLPDYKPASSQSNDVPTFFKAMVQAMDWTFGELLAQIPQAMRANTVVMVWSDNGTQGDAFDTLAKTGIDLTPYLGADYTNKAKRTVYEIGVNIPLIVAGPKVTGAGRQSSAVVSPADLFRTVIELCDGNYAAVPLPPGGTRPAQSFTNVLAGTSTGTRTFAPVDVFGPNGPNTNASTFGSRALAYEGWKLIRNLSTGVTGFPSGTGGTAIAGMEFYNLTTDRYETNNLIGTTPINLTGATLTAYNQAVSDYATAWSTL